MWLQLIPIHACDLLTPAMAEITLQLTNPIIRIFEPIMGTGKVNQLLSMSRGVFRHKRCMLRANVLYCGSHVGCPGFCARAPAVGIQARAVYLSARTGCFTTDAAKYIPKFAFPIFVPNILEERS